MAVNDNQNPIQETTGANTTQNAQTLKDYGYGSIGMRAPEVDATPVPDYSTRVPNLDPKTKEQQSKSQLPGIVGNIRNSVRLNYAQELGAQGSLSQEAIEESYPTGISLRTDVPIDEVYAKLNDGSYVPKYKSYIRGTDNEERLAQKQETWNKWANGIAKAALKTGLYAVSGVVNPIYGLLQAGKTGNFDAVWNNDYMRWMNDVDTKLNYNLPNYYTQAEKDAAFYKKMSTANFWANDFLGGAAFTLGAIGSELVWTGLTGGASAAALAGRTALRSVGKQSLKSSARSYFANAKSVANTYLREVSKASKAAGAINNARFLMTSAGWEASVESFNYLKEAEQNYEDAYKAQYGRRPSADEMARFKKESIKAGNLVFGANIGIVGMSNILMFGQYFGVGKGFGGIDRAVDKLFGVGATYNKAGKLERVAYNKWKKGLGTTYNVLKRPFTEGVWEEGTQGVAAKAASSYIESRYNPGATQKNIDALDAIINGFKESYGTQEGRMEIGIGALMGFAMGGNSHVFGIKEWSNKSRVLDAKIEAYNGMDIPQSAINTMARFKYVNQQIAALDKAEQAGENGDTYTSRQEYDTALFAKMQMDEEFGLLDDSRQNFERMVDNMDLTEMSTEYGISAEEAQILKDKAKADYASRLEDFRTSTEFAESLVSGSKYEFMKPIVAQNMFLGIRARNNMQTVANIIGDMANNGNLAEALNYYSSLSKEGQQLEKRKAGIQEEIDQLSSEVNRLNTAFRTEEDTKKLEEKTRELAGLNQQLDEIQQKLNVQGKDFNPIDFSLSNRETNPETIPGAIADAYQNLHRLDAYIDQLSRSSKESDKQKARIFENLIDDYSKSYVDYRSFNEALLRMNDSRFMEKEAKGLLRFLQSKSEEQYKEPESEDHIQTADILNRSDEELKKAYEKGKISEDELYTFQTFNHMIDTYRRQGSLSEAEVQERIPDDVWNEIESGNISAYDLTSVVNRVYDELPLSLREQAVYDKYKTEIDEAISERPNSPAKQLQKIQRDIENLKNPISRPAKTVNDEIIQRVVDETKVDADQSGVDLQKLIDGLNTAMSKFDGGDESQIDTINTLSDQIDAIGNKYDVDGLSYFVKQNHYIDRGSELYSPTTSSTSIDDVVGNTPASESNKQVFDNAKSIQVVTARLARKGKRGERSYHLSGITIDSFIEKVGAVLNPNVVGFTTETKSNGKTMVFTLDTGETLKMSVRETDEHSRIGLSEDAVKTILEPNTGIVISEQTSISSAPSVEVLQRNPDNTYSPIKTNIQYGKYGKVGGYSVDENAVLEANKGDEVELSIDISDGYNKLLLKEVETAASEGGEKHSQAIRKLVDNMVILIKDRQGRLVSVLSSTGNESDMSLPGYAGVEAIRQAAAQELIGTTRRSGVIKLSGSYKIADMLPGRPSFVVRGTENNGLEVENIPITEAAAQSIESIGYILNGKLHLKDKVDYNQWPFVTSILREGNPGDKYHNQKVPVAVIKHRNGQNYVYPISVKEGTGSNNDTFIEYLDYLIENPDAINKEEIQAVNVEAARIGISPDAIQIPLSGTYQMAVNALQSMKTEVRARSQYQDAGSWITDSRSSREIAVENGMININLETGPFHSAKIRVDFSTTKPSQKKHDAQQDTEELPFPTSVDDAINKPC